MARHPRNVDALAELGHAYTRLGRWELGLEVDHQLVRLVPDNPTVHYNLACSLALLDRRDASLDALELAVEFGYVDLEFMQQDEDLANLRPEERFQTIMRRVRAEAAS